MQFSQCTGDVTMITVKLRYSDGQITIRQFKDKKEAEWFIHNEGDHLL